MRRVRLNPDGTLTDEDTGLPVEVPPCREMTDGEIEDAALSDPDNPPLTEDDFRRMRVRVSPPEFSEGPVFAPPFRPEHGCGCLMCLAETPGGLR